jgi:hypothetical protein
VLFILFRVQLGSLISLSCNVALFLTLCASQIATFCRRSIINCCILEPCTPSSTGDAILTYKGVPTAGKCQSGEKNLSPPSLDHCVGIRNCSAKACLGIIIQGNSRVIMSPTELKMQPTLHFRKKLAVEIQISSFFRKCIVGCIFDSVGLIITRE